MTKIETTHFTLRPYEFTDADYANLRLLDSELEIMKYTPASIPQTPEQTRERLLRYSKMEGVYSVEKKSDNQFIGWFMLRETDLAFPEIGFMIVKSAWGKGFATEIARGIIEHGISILGYSGISARTTPDNKASINVLRKLGFVQSGMKDELLVFELVAEAVLKNHF